MNGILVINKEQNYTSRDVVNVVSKTLGIKKIGHTGTLDPMATGVLVLCIGQATKLVELLMDHDKEYIAGVTLGIQTDTLDATGTILKEEYVVKTKEEIEETLLSFLGTYDQEVPMYSAVKVRGKKLYEYARANKKVDLPKKKVTISFIELLNDPIFHEGKVSFSFKTTVSKGTYIRSLIRDIAARLDTIGIMTSLERTRVGEYTLADAIFLNQVDPKVELCPIKTALSNYQEVVVSDVLLKKVCNGAKVFHTYESDIVLFVNQQGSPLALYKKDEKNEKMLKSWKMFVSSDSI